jgi:hypothetical protein
VVDTGRQNNQIVFLGLQSNPLVVLVADIEIARAVKHKSYLIVRVQMLSVEDLELFVVAIFCYNFKILKKLS